MLRFLTLTSIGFLLAFVSTSAVAAGQTPRDALPSEARELRFRSGDLELTTAGDVFHLGAGDLVAFYTDAGVPPGVCNVVQGFGDAGAAMVDDERVDLLVADGDLSVFVTRPISLVLVVLILLLVASQIPALRRRTARLVGRGRDILQRG